MILLQGHGLTRARKIPMETLSLSLSERASTASMTPADMTGIGIGSWMLDETDPGAGIVWRVKTITQAYATDTPTVQLEHVINTLRDVLLFGEHTPSMISGGDTCTAEQAIRYILARQSDWVLYRFDYPSVSNPYKFDGDTLFDALETVTNSLDDAWWEYDMSVYPFRLSIVQKSADVLTEMRAGRNIRTINRKVDKTGMYTRFYPIGENDLHITGDYVERNATTYGVISKVETDNSLGTEAELRRWAEERLRDHAEPTVSIDVDGVELVDATGESLDKMHLGAMCRIPLPEFNTTILERIVGLSYLDKVHQPESVRITLANNRTDITRIVADAIKSGATGKSGRTSAKRAKQDNAWFEDTSEHVAMCAKGIIGVDAQGNPNWTQLAQIIVDGTGIHQRVTETESGIATHQTAIEANEREITLEAEARGAADEELSSAILLTATNIRAEVSASNCQIYSYIDMTACGIYARMRNTGREIYDGPSAPSGTVSEGAIWIKTPYARTWEDAETALTWMENPYYNWDDLGGSKFYEWVIDEETGNYEWKEILNEAALAQDSSIDDLASGLSRTYRSIEIENGKLAVMQSHLEVTANHLSNEIEDRYQKLGSSINQTKSEITSELHAANSQIYSVIRQTSTNLVVDYVDKVSDVASYTERTASQIKTELYASRSQIYNTVMETATNFYRHIGNEIDGVHSEISMTACEIYTSVWSGGSSLYSQLLMTSTNIYATVSDVEEGLQSSIEAEASRISLVVQGTGSNAKIRPAKIVEAINEAGSSVVIDADHINIGSAGSTIGLDGYVTVSNGALNVKTALLVGTTTGQIVSVNGGNVQAPTIQVNSGGKLTFVGSSQGEVYNLTAVNITGFIKSASVSGNTLTFTNVAGSTINFSKATSLSGAWSSGTYTVTAKQTNSGTQTTVATHTTNNQIVFDGNGSSNFSVKLQTREGSASTFTDRLSKYCYLVLSGSGRSQSVKAGANSDGSGSVGSISVSSVYDEGRAAGIIAGWDAACAQISRLTNTIRGPKPTSENNGAIGGVKNYYTATAEYSLNTGSPWGKAKLHVDRYVGSTKVSQDTYGYEVENEVTDSGGVRYVYQATDGYWGWNTEPSASAWITWS